jgi:hypothetical protein
MQQTTRREFSDGIYSVPPLYELDQFHEWVCKAKSLQSELKFPIDIHVNTNNLFQTSSRPADFEENTDDPRRT